MAEAGAPLRVPVTVACRVLGYSTQAYYKWKKQPISGRDWSDAKIVNELHDINGEDPTLGYRFLTDELEEVGIKRSENSVHRLCRVGGISACHAAKKGKNKKPGPPVHDDMLAKVDDCGRVRHHFAASRPDEVWRPTSPSIRPVKASSTSAPSRTSARVASSATRWIHGCALRWRQQRSATRSP